MDVAGLGGLDVKILPREERLSRSHRRTNGVERGTSNLETKSGNLEVETAFGTVRRIVISQ
jgi:hypothetical protein